MFTGFFRNVITLGLTLLLGATLAIAQSDDKSKFKPLDEKNDPLLIGKRDINKGQLDFYSLEREIAIGRQLAAQVDRESPIITEPVINEYVNRIAQNLVLHSDSKVPFTVKIIDADDVNAFALPGGFLYVNRGLIEAAENEAEVAGVLAHEIAHVAARHGVEQASKGELLNYASIPLIFLGGWGGYIVRQVAGLAVPLTFLKFSRGAEKEADRLGAQYMWASGYDPNALITFFEKLQAKDKKKPGTLAKVFSTHPMTGDRIAEVRDLIVKFPDRGEYQISSSEFNDVRSRLTAAGAASRAASREAESRRPTLKRRPKTTTDDDVDVSETPDRPVLKRRDSSDADPSSEAGATSEEGDRPVLKRRDSSELGSGSDAPGANSKDESAGRPTLKRSDGSKPEESKSDGTKSGKLKTEGAKPGEKTASPPQQGSTDESGKPTLRRRPDQSNNP
jgi:Zn-dependent protease with chaperone function